MKEVVGEQVVLEAVDLNKERNMLIIVEGMDCTSKSTLCRYIEKQFGFEYYKESLGYKERLVPNYDGGKHYKDLSKHLLSRKKNLVIDRFHLGEIINPIIRKDGRRPLSMDELKDIENILNPHSVLILCDTSINFIENAFSHRGEEIADKNDIQYLKYLYYSFFKASKIRSKRIFDVEKDTNFFNISKYLKIKINRYNKKYKNI